MTNRPTYQIKNIYGNRIFLFISLLLIYRPEIFVQIRITEMIWDVGRVILCAFLLLTYALYNHYSKLFVFEIVIWGWYNLYSLYLDVWDFNVLIKFLLILMITILVEMSATQDIMQLIKSLRMILVIYLIANTITIILGFDVSSLFLGFDNDIIMILIPMIGVLTWGAFYENGTLKKIDYFIYLMVFFDFFATKAVTAIVSLLTYVCVLFFMNRKIAVKFIGDKKDKIASLFTSGKGIAYAIILWVFVAVFQVQKLFASSLYYLLHRDVTLTNRIYIWERVIEAVKVHPILGYGNYALNEEYLSYFRYWVSCPHNLFLHFLATGGIVGFIAIIMLYNYSFRNVNKNQNGFVDFILLATSFTFMICGLASSYYPMESLFLLLAIANITPKVKTMENIS